MTSTTEKYRAARDLLQESSRDYAAAVARFSWPDFGERFNWAVDWFDAIARGVERTALWIVEEDGSEARYSSTRWHGAPTRSPRFSPRTAWSAEIACTDLADRIARGGVKHVLANAKDAAKFGSVPGEYRKFAVGAEIPDGWIGYGDAYALDVPPTPHPGTAPSDPQLLYFTSGTTSRPKLVEHTQVSYPVGHLATSFWVAAKPGDVHLNISSPGWAKHAWSCFFAPWIAEATIFVHNYARFDAPALLDQIRRAGVNTFCAPPTVWRMLIKADLTGGPGALRELMSAGEPLNPEVMDQVRGAWGLTIRDGYGQTELPLAVGNVPGCRSSRARWACRCRACRSCSWTRSPASRPMRGRSASTCRSGR